jgi:hypothetical protein
MSMLHIENVIQLNSFFTKQYMRAIVLTFFAFLICGLAILAGRTFIQIYNKV